MERFVCVHGHFYQPPRENPWLGEIELQESARPYHDWNERIHAECYGPNSAARILNDEKRIIRIINNYSEISFNFGPTLLSWIEKYQGNTYLQILEADLVSRARHNGHGNAIAQVYNHVIMPLANARDKETQILWGIADFKYRFKRAPEGMWLAETAVDTETLELMVKHNIAFTILAPRQAKAIKMAGSAEWVEIEDANALDTSQPYWCKLPSGRRIALFFYNETVSHALAFNGLLNSGNVFAETLKQQFQPKKAQAQLVHAATDGESYGHHHKFGEMALATCLSLLKDDPEVRLTNYGEFLSLFPPKHEVAIHENSSWSCVHGVERWRSDCGCNDGANKNFHQKWRKPLRNALNWLRDEVAAIFETELTAMQVDPWGLRNAYIDYQLDKDEEKLKATIREFSLREITEEQRLKIVRLLEMQRNAMLMFTSCGWFFDDVTRIETRQILQYADRVIQIAEGETKIKLYDAFLTMLQSAPSNIEQYGNAAVMYKREIRPMRLDLNGVGMHWAAASLFEEFPEKLSMFNYRSQVDFFERLEAGNLRLCFGRIRIASNATFYEKPFIFTAVYIGQQHILGYYADGMETDVFEEMYLRARDAFRNAQMSEVFNIMQQTFGESRFSFRDLFKDEQSKVLQNIINQDILNAQVGYKNIYDSTYNLANVMRQNNLPIPGILLKNMEIVINNEIGKFFETGNSNPVRLDKLSEEVSKWKINLDAESLNKKASEWLLQKVRFLERNVDDLSAMDELSRILIRLSEMKLQPDIYEVQNAYFRIGDNYLGNARFKNLLKTRYAKWALRFKSVGEQLNIRFE